MERTERPYILICDDSAEEIRVIVAMLLSANYRIAIATNGREACVRAGVLRPDLILLDIRMPGMDGLATCRILKAHTDTQSIPVIFLTAANDIADRLAGLRCGAVDYIVKPANEEEVLLRVSAHVKRRESDRHFDSTRHPREIGALVQACVELLELDLSATPTTERLCKALGTTRLRLAHAFQEVFGTTVYGWLRERRMQQARDWLTYTNMPISMVAESLGYTSGGNFTTAFKERFGVIPRAFRQETQRELVRTGRPLQAPPQTSSDSAVYT